MNAHASTPAFPSWAFPRPPPLISSKRFISSPWVFERPGVGQLFLHSGADLRALDALQLLAKPSDAVGPRPERSLRLLDGASGGNPSACAGQLRSTQQPLLADPRQPLGAAKNERHSTSVPKATPWLGSATTQSEAAMATEAGSRGADGRTGCFPVSRRRPPAPTGRSLPSADPVLPRQSSVA